MLEIKSYGTQLRYECGLARKFHDEIYDETYDERRMTCNWNNSWSEHDSLDPCIWVQCLYPPLPPPTSNLKLIWDGSPVNFTHNVSYVCKSDDLYFEWDRDMEEFNITCLEDGSWDAPDIWPICVNCKGIPYMVKVVTYFFSC